MIKGVLRKLVFDRDAYEAAFNAGIQEALHESLRAFLQAAAIAIPVDTGQAKGSLLKLSRFLGEVIAIDNSTPQPGKDILTGEALGVLTVQLPTRDNPVYKVILTTGVKYFELMDQVGKGRGPWRSRKAARAAFQADLESRIAKATPPFGKYLRSIEVRI